MGRFSQLIIGALMGSHEESRKAQQYKEHNGLG